MPGSTLVSLICGHSYFAEQIKADNFTDVVEQYRSADNCALYDFQKVCTEFVKSSGARTLLTLEMGLGKTPISLVSTKLLELTPVLFVTKSKLLIQTLRETMRWGNETIAQIIEGPDDLRKGFILPVNYYIISVDMLRKFNDAELDSLLPGKTIVLDECQHIKNVDSQRSVAVRKLCRNREHVIALSATPIKNRFDEYFPILNILHPERFPSYADFMRKWCVTSVNAYGEKAGACVDPERFQEETKDFIIRFVRDEVMPDLPKIRRSFQYHKLPDAEARAYDKLNAEFVDYYENTTDSGFALVQNLLAYYAKMRHLTGIAKIDAIVDHASEFILTTNRKLTIFTQHKLVASMIEKHLNSILADGGFSPCLRLEGGTTDLETDAVVQKFKLPEHRIMIASTLAAGEGLNLQFCSDYVMAERQWNPSNEEQAEGRFPRPGSTASSVEGTYMIALGTIDEWLTEMVEGKRMIVNSALTGKQVEWDQNSIVTELADMIVSKMEGKRWK